MTIKQTDNSKKITGMYEVRGTTYTDGGNVFYYSWNIEFNNESIQDFIDSTEIKNLNITGVRSIVSM